jgi:hypothetical protein
MITTSDWNFPMINNSFLALTLVSVLGCGLIGGVFFAFSTFVMKALASLPPAQGIAAMQSINVTVGCFGGKKAETAPSTMTCSLRLLDRSCPGLARRTLPAALAAWRCSQQSESGPSGEQVP